MTAGFDALRLLVVLVVVSGEVFCDCVYLVCLLQICWSCGLIVGDLLFSVYVVFGLFVLNSVGVIYMIYVCVFGFVFVSDVGLLRNMFSYGCLCFVWNSGWFLCLV